MGSHSTPEQIKEIAQYFGLQSNPALYDGSHQVWTDSTAENWIINGDASYILGQIIDPQSVDMIYTCPPPLGFLKDAVLIQTLKERFVGTQTEIDPYLTRLLEIMGGPCYRVLKDTGHIWIDLPDIYSEELGTYMGIPETFYLSMIYGSTFGGADNNKKGLTYYAADKPLWHRTYDPTVALPILKKRLKRDWEHIHHFTKQRHEDCYWNESKSSFDGKTSILAAELDYEKEESTDIESGYPEKLIETAINLSCPPGGTVLDPMCGTGTTGKVAKRMGRKFIMVDLSFNVAADIATKVFKFEEVGAKSNI